MRQVTDAVNVVKDGLVNPTHMVLGPAVHKVVANMWQEIKPSKRKLSAAGREAISRAAKKRWRKFHRAKGMMQAKTASGPKTISITVEVDKVVALCRMLDYGKEALLAENIKNQIISKLASAVSGVNFDDLDMEEEEG